MLRVIFSTALLLALNAGCASFFSRIVFASGENLDNDSPTRSGPYLATRLDGAFLHDAVFEKPRWSPRYWVPLFYIVPLTFADVPISIACDTVLLPFDLYLLLTVPDSSAPESGKEHDTQASGDAPRSNGATPRPEVRRMIQDYMLVFGEYDRESISILNSLVRVVDEPNKRNPSIYSWKFKLLVPQSWIDATKKKYDLAPEREPDLKIGPRPTWFLPPISRFYTFWVPKNAAEQKVYLFVEPTYPTSKRHLVFFFSLR